MLRAIAALALVCTLQVVLVAAQSPAAAPAINATAAAPTPAAVSPVAELQQDLDDLGIPSADITGKILAGANPVQIAAAISSLITSRITAAYQASALTATEDTQAVVSALADPSVSPALSPAAKAEYDAAQALYRNPALSLSPAISSGGRKLLTE